MSRCTAMTSLLNGQAVNVEDASTNVTLIRGSSRLSARAQVAPAKPPPTTTTLPPAFWASPGRGNSAAEAPAAAVLMKSRRLLRFSIMTSILLRRVPGRDGPDFVIGEAFGDAVHDGRRPRARAELLDGSHDLRRILSLEALDRRVHS